MKRFEFFKFVSLYLWNINFFLSEYVNVHKISVYSYARTNALRYARAYTYIHVYIFIYSKCV